MLLSTVQSEDVMKVTFHQEITEEVIADFSRLKFDFNKILFGSEEFDIELIKKIEFIPSTSAVIEKQKNSGFHSEHITVVHLLNSLKLKVSQKGLLQVHLYDVRGRKIQTLYNNTTRAKLLSIPLPKGNISAGNYIVVAKLNNIIITSKITIR